MLFDIAKHVQCDGMDSSYLYIKRGFQFFGLHVEQLSLPYVHHQLFGQSHWIIIPHRERDKLVGVIREMAQRLCVKKKKVTVQPLHARLLLHASRRFMPPIALLEKHSVQRYEVTLEAGQMLIAHGGFAHYGFSTCAGETVSVARNLFTANFLIDGGLQFVMLFYTDILQLSKEAVITSDDGRTFCWSHDVIGWEDLCQALNRCPQGYTCAVLRGLAENISTHPYMYSFLADEESRKKMIHCLCAVIELGHKVKRQMISIGVLNKEGHCACGADDGDDESVRSSASSVIDDQRSINENLCEPSKTDSKEQNGMDFGQSEGEQQEAADSSAQGIAMDDVGININVEGRTVSASPHSAHSTQLAHVNIMSPSSELCGVDAHILLLCDDIIRKRSISTTPVPVPLSSDVPAIPLMDELLSYFSLRGRQKLRMIPYTDRTSLAIVSMSKDNQDCYYYWMAVVVGTTMPWIKEAIIQTATHWEGVKPHNRDDETKKKKQLVCTNIEQWVGQYQSTVHPLPTLLQRFKAKIHDGGQWGGNFLSGILALHPHCGHVLPCTVTVEPNCFVDYGTEQDNQTSVACCLLQGNHYHAVWEVAATQGEAEPHACPIQHFAIQGENVASRRRWTKRTFLHGIQEAFQKAFPASPSKSISTIEILNDTS
jgi:hypothetical protein